MHRRIFAHVTLACALIAAALFASSAPASASTKLTRIIYIMMENQGFDDIIGHDNATGNMDTPFITTLALRYGLGTLSFGTTHPSLPNYLSLFAGDFFGIHDDNPSCFAVPKQSTCDMQAANATNLVDELEAKGLTWTELMQSMPTVGFKGPQYPTAASGPVLYAQKHNPVMYFKDVATNPARLKHILPLNSMSTLSAVLGSATKSPNFVFIVPDQCHDMHGTSTCPSGDALLKAGDQYVEQLVTTITKSPAWTPTTAIIIAWDEDDYSSNLQCCQVEGIGGGHIPLIVITPNQKQPMRMDAPTNHYTELSTIEAEFGLKPLGKSAFLAPVLMNLIP